MCCGCDIIFEFDLVVFRDMLYVLRKNVSCCSSRFWRRTASRSWWCSSHLACLWSTTMSCSITSICPSWPFTWVTETYVHKARWKVLLKQCDECFCFHGLTGEAETDEENYNVFPVLQRRLWHSPLYGRGCPRSRYPRGGLDCSVRPTRWPKGTAVTPPSLALLIDICACIWIFMWLFCWFLGVHPPCGTNSSWY